MGANQSLNMAELPEGTSDGLLSELPSVFLSTTPERSHLPREFTNPRQKNGGKSALFWEAGVQKSQVSEREPTTLPSKADGETPADKSARFLEDSVARRTQTSDLPHPATSSEMGPQKRERTDGVSKQSSDDLEKQKSQLLDENSVLAKEITQFHQREASGRSTGRRTDLEKEIVVLRVRGGVLHDEIRCAESRLRTQKVLKERCVELETEKQRISDENRALQATLAELSEEIEPQWSMQRFQELLDEVAAMRTHRDLLQKDIACATSKLEHQTTIKQHCAELEERRNRICAENKTIQGELTEICRKIQPEESMEKRIEEAKDFEKEIKKLRSDTGLLKDELERAKAKELEQASLRERCFELQAERKRIRVENEAIRENISVILGKIAHDKSWKQKLEVMRVSKSALQSENAHLTQHKEKLTRQCYELKNAAFGHKLQLREMSELRADNLRLQGDVHNLLRDVRNHISLRKSYKDIAKKDAQVKAKNKKLRKEVEDLQKELDKLRNVKDEHENFKQDLDELREDNYHLHRRIQELNNDLRSTKGLKVHTKSLKAEHKRCLQINRDLTKEISCLKGIQWEQLPLREECEEWGERNRRIRQANRKLRRQMEEEFVEAHGGEVQAILTGALKTEHEEMDRLNQELTRDIEKLRSAAV